MILNSAVKAFGILSVSALIACGGSGDNPVTGGTVDTDVDPTDPNVVTGQKFAFDRSVGLVANSIEFRENVAGDPSDDQLVINNIPFDTTTGEYDRTGTLPNGWGLYQNTERNLEGRLQYYAVFNQSATADVEGGVAASPQYRGSIGNAGAVIRRSGTPVSLPVAGIFNYNGSYSGIREIDNDLDTTGTVPGITLVTGDALVRVDYGDFDVTGDIVGSISNRNVYDVNGTFLGSLSNVSLAEALIDRPTQTINESGASSQDGLLSGTWEGVFGGPTGNEIAAYVILNGTTPDTPGATPLDPVIPGVGVRELGVLLVAQ
ncbi:hypothetical protein [Litoreibacter halocynthiae]|uniref:hypothetical protein n=1 Tax=Litoreibacter halocynthiae TaxID=1242689 RepID=UPI00248FC8E7|nr:hypothetical protein [Litoreibacter halocynthiae]